MLYALYVALAREEVGVEALERDLLHARRPAKIVPALDHDGKGSATERGAPECQALLRERSVLRHDQIGEQPLCTRTLA